MGREFRRKRNGLLAEEESFLIFSAVQQQLHDGAHSCTTAPIDVQKSWNLFPCCFCLCSFREEILTCRSKTVEVGWVGYKYKMYIRLFSSNQKYLDGLTTQFFCLIHAQNIHVWKPIWTEFLFAPTMVVISQCQPCAFFVLDQLSFHHNTISLSLDSCHRLWQAKESWMFEWVARIQIMFMGFSQQSLMARMVDCRNHWQC